MIQKKKIYTYRYAIIFLISVAYLFLATYICAHNPKFIEYDYLPFKLFIKTFYYSFFTLPLVILAFWVGPWIGTGIIFIIFSILLFYVYVCFKYNVISIDMLTVIAGTSKAEAWSMLHSVHPIYFFILLVSLLLLSVLTFKISRFSPKKLLFFPFLLIPAFLSSYLAYKKHTHPAVKEGMFFSQEHDQNIIFLWASMPGWLGNTFYMSKILAIKTNSFLTHTAHAKTDPSIASPPPRNGEQNIIFILGESDFAPHHNIYGYSQQETTPEQSRLLKADRLCFIKKAHSAANFTRNAVPIIFSFATPDHQENLLQEKNIIELANQAGYRTSWIGTQDYFSYGDRTLQYLVNYSKNVIAPGYNTKPGGRNPVVNDDDTLLPFIEEDFKDSSPYKFYVIHIIGSHDSYTDKYTEDDTRALPNASPYDRSIHHTDRLIQKIVNIADKELKHYTIFYSSDHGEIINKGHGLHYGGYDQYNIPVFFIGDKHNYYCDLAEKMRNDNQYFTESKEKFILLDMLGYSVKPDAIAQEKKIDHVLHSDGNVYDYATIPTSRK